MMKILFIGPLPDPITGHSLACKVFLDELTNHHQVDVVNLGKESFKNGLNSIKRIGEILNVLYQVWRKKKGKDIIYLTISESYAGNVKDLLIYLICYKYLSKMYIHLHGGSIRRLHWDRHKVIFLINKKLIKRLAGVIISGQSHINIFEDIIHKEKIHIVPNFAQEYLFLTEKEILDKFSSIQPLRILFVSNFINEKGFNELVDAYFSLNPALRKKVRIDFAGKFELESQKIAFLKKIDDANQIYFHGLVNEAQKKDLFSQAHVFCLPTSLFEGQPLSVLEAYASGCVVLITGQRGVLDVFVDGLNGFEIKERSAESINLALEKTFSKIEKLHQIAVFNRKIAGEKYRTSIYNSSLRRIIEQI